MATYSTDLTTLTTAESGTWLELTGTILGFTLSGAGTPTMDTENYIQGTNCYSQTTGKAQDAEISIVFDYTTGYTFSAGYVVFAWLFYAVGTNLKTKANSGYMFVICSSLTAGDYFVVSGSDSGRNPYGGWFNVAVDPTATESGTLGGGGNGGTYRYFGQVCNTIGEISKGTPSGVDAIRAGRGIISITGSGGSFSELAEYNDYNDGGTPPGTSSTSVDSGRHRLGLFQESAGTFLWKGLLSLGTSGASVTFSGSNSTIIIDDCPHTYPSFNKIEINNGSSSVTLTNISVISTASTANGIGYFEMVANATVVKTGCLFVNMGTFIYQSNATITGCSFVKCGTVTQGSAVISGCLFSESTGTKALVANTLSQVSKCEFISAGTGYAIEGFSAIDGSYTLNAIRFTGYAGSHGSSGNECIHILAASGLTTIYYPGGDAPTYHTEGATVVLVAASYDFKFTVNPSITGYEWRIYSVTALGSLTGAVELDGEETATLDNQTLTYEYAGAVFIAVQIISQPDEDYVESITYYTLGEADQDIIINLDRDINN